MFAGLSHLPASAQRLPDAATPAKDVPPPTPVRFPHVLPKSRVDPAGPEPPPPLVPFLRTIQRPGDVKIEHLEALGLHVINDVPLQDLIPDPQCLPAPSWISTPADEIDDEDAKSSHPLNNGRPSPGARTYVERVKELSVQNAAAFRTVRRIPAPAGETNARLGNAYEFFKNLELMSSFWDDTSLPRPPEKDADAMDVDSESLHDTHDAPESNPPNPYDQIQTRSGTGSQTPPDFRLALLSALVKLVAYDFGCNVSYPRIEPRLYISPPPTSNSEESSPAASSFPTNVSFIYRTPTDRLSARTGIVEGPVAAMSARHSTGFDTHLDCVLDLAREATAILTTAQQRAREHKPERKVPDDVWWCHKPRWGGGPGGPIGREAEREEAALSSPSSASSSPMSPTSPDAPSSSATDETLDPNSSSSNVPVSTPKPLPHSTRDRKRRTMTMYDNYRMVRPPSSTWDRKARYLAIGKPTHATHDDIFLLSCLNHHVCIVRAHVPMRLLEELAGEVEADMAADAAVDGKAKSAAAAAPTGAILRQQCIMYRSKWHDMFLADERVAAMTALWGMMAYLMRAMDEPEPEAKAKTKATSGPPTTAADAP